MNGGAKTCRISSKAIYRALGVENIRHRRQASNLVVMRRLLSLDFVLEHPGMNWLPAEPEKVEFFEEIGPGESLTGTGLVAPSLQRRIKPRIIARYDGKSENKCSSARAEGEPPAWLWGF